MRSPLTTPIVRQRWSMLAGIVCLSLAMGNMAGLVVCFGSDGHIAIEPRSSGHCCGLPGAANASESSFQVAAAPGDRDFHTPCGCRLDLPISILSEGIAPLPAFVTFAPAAAPAAALGIPAEEPEAVTSLRAHASHCCGQGICLALLSAVVLLI
ncbi:MAG: hypothetical protein AB1640_17090 [bacterium]